MRSVKKYNWFLFLAIFLYVLSFILILEYFKNLKTYDKSNVYTSYSKTIANSNKNKEPNSFMLEDSLLKKRLWALDSIYTTINELYTKESDLYSKGLANKKNVKVLEIEKNMALQTLLRYKKRQLKDLSSKTEALIQ